MLVKQESLVIALIINASSWLFSFLFFLVVTGFSSNHPAHFLLFYIEKEQKLNCKLFIYSLMDSTATSANLMSWKRIDHFYTNLLPIVFVIVFLDKTTYILDFYKIEFIIFFYNLFYWKHFIYNTRHIIITFYLENQKHLQKSSLRNYSSLLYIFVFKNKTLIGLRKYW